MRSGCESETIGTMPIRQLQLQCAKCDAVMPHNQKTPNHVLHAVVSLLVIGLWIPVWIAVAMGKEPATCVKCGNQRKVDGPATLTQAYEGVDNSTIRFGVAIAVAGLAAALIYGAVTGGGWQ